MVSPTRRALLSGAAGLAAGLAGCSGLLDGSAESNRTEPRDDSASESETNPETLSVRADTDRPPVWLAKSDGDDSRPTTREHEHSRRHIVVDDSARADRLMVADAVDRGRVQSFLAATDFETETVYVEMGSVEECFRHTLCHISWTPTSISTDYVRQSRPYTERCAVDDRVIEARLIRIPDAIEADDVNSYSSSVGTGVCDHRGGNAEGERGAEVATTREHTGWTESAPTGSRGDRG
jgi:hypothetical protein